MAEWSRIVTAVSNVIIACLVLVVTTSAFLFGSINQAHACSCIQPRPPIEELSQRAAIFEGKVVDVDTKNFDRIITFEVYKAWKGLGALADITKVVTPGSDASCGYNFEEGREYVVYANGGSDMLEVNHCSRTTSVADAYEDLAELGPGVDVASLYPSKDPSGGVAYDTREDPVIYANVFLPVVIMVAVAGSAVGMCIVILRSKPKEGQRSV